jgi:hypothetical protein
MKTFNMLNTLAKGFGFCQQSAYQPSDFLWGLLSHSVWTWFDLLIYKYSIKRGFVVKGIYADGFVDE